MGLNDTAYLKARIAAIKTTIEAYETAITAVLSKGVKSYTLDTGQNTVTVTNQNIVSIQNAYTAMLNLLAVLEARLKGAAGAGGACW